MKPITPTLASSAILLLLAACGDGNDQGAAPAAAEGMVFRPGRWQVENTIAGGMQQNEHLCITDEQARSGKFLAGNLPDGCKVDRNVIADGQIDIAIVCGKGEQTMGSTVAGTYDADTYRVESTIALGAGNTIRATSAATFVGEECQAGDIGLQGRATE